MELGDKIIWWVLAAALVSGLIVAMIKVGEIIVRRRTYSMIHESDADRPSSSDED